jgi:4-oxalmesaconate hydratase
MIIDCHAHYTTAPAAHVQWRAQQLEAFRSGTAVPPYPSIPDDDIRETLESYALRTMDERGIDVTLFSPRASAMEHHRGDQSVSDAWAYVCNDLIARVAGLFPRRFAGVAQLPQVPDSSVQPVIRELRRCVEELGFVACNLNPDPSGGFWTGPPLTDRYWYPMYEELVTLGVPAMIHVSRSCNANFHGEGAHYINADTTAFMQLLQGDLFADFPDLRFIIPHGGGAVPFHWGRYRGLAQMLGKPPVEDHVMNNVWFDTCVYHQPGFDMLFSVIDHKNLLFASEMHGAVRGIDPYTDQYFDNTKVYLDKLSLSAPDYRRVVEANARAVYPRLNERLAAEETATPR